MTINKTDVRKQVYSLQQHHTNVLKKVDKMKSKCDIAGAVLDKEINNVADAMSQVFLVFYQSIQDLNEDKEYFNKKLQNMSKMKDALTDYVKELNDITIEVNNSNKNDKNYDEATIIDNAVKRLDKMTSAMNSCNSLLSSSREGGQNEIIKLLSNINSNILHIKTKLLKKVLPDPIIRKSPLIDKKLVDKKSGISVLTSSLRLR